MRNTKRRALPLLGMSFTTGTWTPSVASDVPINTKTATDETSTVLIPISIPIPYDPIAVTGIIPKKVILPYSNATADLDAAPTLKLFKVTTNATTKAVTGTEIASTLSGAVVGQGTKELVLDVNAEVLVNAADSLYAIATFNAAATSVIAVKGGQFEYIENDYSVA